MDTPTLLNAPLELKLYTSLLTAHFFLVLVFALQSGLDLAIALLSVPLVLVVDAVAGLLQPHCFVLRR